MANLNNPFHPFRRRAGWHPGSLALVLAMGLAAPVLRAQDSEVITKVVVKGALKMTSATVLYKAGVKEGDDLRNLDLTAVLERLWASGAFDDIKFEVEDDKEKGGRKLIILVKERPLVKEVDYRGGTEVGLSGLKDKIKEKKLEIKPDTLYDPEATRKLKNLIVEQAAEKGYRNPVVDVALEPMGTGIARLVFDIKEGGKVRIYEVKFKGNKVLPSSELARVMEKTRKHWMFSWLTSHDLLVDKNMEEDVLNLKRAYWRRGYKDVFVGQPIIEIEDHTSEQQKKKNIKRLAELKSAKTDMRAKLVIPILEGERYYTGKLKIEGNEKVFKGPKGLEHLRMKLATEARNNQGWLGKFLELKPSIEDVPADKQVPFDLDSLEKGIEKVEEEYRNQAYVRAQVERKQDIRLEGGVKKVDTTLKIHEGEMYTIRKIQFEGNDTTKDKVLRRGLYIQEGDPYRMELLKESYMGLGQLGFFDVKGSEPKIEQVQDKPQVDITMVGEEAGVNELLFQGGYSTLFQLSLGMQFSTRNLGGGGETLAFSFNTGKFQKNFSVSFTEPYVFDQPYSFGASISNGSVDYDASRVGSANAYRQFTRSVGLSTGARLSNFIPGNWAFRTQIGMSYSVSLMRIEGGQSWFYRDTNTQMTSQLGVHVSYNTVNHPFKPTFGDKLTVGMEYGGWQFGGDKPFYRLTLEGQRFRNIGERHIFGINASYGYLGNLGREALSIFNLYRPGGENSIRGYRWGNVGSIVTYNGTPSVVGGNKQFIANAEYQFKIADQFRIVFFYDAGNAWAQGQSSFSTALKRSTGIEARFFLPISPAPLRLIYSRKINPYAFDLDGKTDFQFSIGTTF